MFRSIQSAFFIYTLVSIFVLMLSTKVSGNTSTFITIGTGIITGVYYPTGGAIARMINKDRKVHGIRCTVEATGGSIFNLKSIASGDIQMGIVRSDWQYHAYNGTSEFKVSGPNKDLRAVFSIQPDAFTVVAQSGAGVSDFSDLKGKRVNIGSPGSIGRHTLEVLMTELGWTTDAFSHVMEEGVDRNLPSLFCDNRVDAIIYHAIHPDSTLKEINSHLCSRSPVIVRVTGSAVEQLIAQNSYYRSATIPGDVYTGITSDTETFGVGVTLVTSATVPEFVIYETVKVVFENFDDFKKLHPSFSTLRKEEMVNDNLSAPLHDGALKYYKEVGLLSKKPPVKPPVNRPGNMNTINLLLLEKE